MSTQPQLSPLEQLAASGKQSTTPSQPAAPTQSNLSPLEQLAAVKPAQQSTDPSQTGEITNDVGNKVIVPKDGESFNDTMKRAVAYHNSLSPDQLQAAMDAETKTIPAKTAQTLGSAAAIGAVGPAVMAAPGEIAGLAPEAVSAVKALIQAHPTAAKVLGKVILSSAMGGEVGHSAKSAIIGAMLGGLL
jgi:hypothetical protein